LLLIGLAGDLIVLTNGLILIPVVLIAGVVLWVRHRSHHGAARATTPFWDGFHWLSQDRQWWSDGNRWLPGAPPPQASPPPPLPSPQESLPASPRPLYGTLAWHAARKPEGHFKFDGEQWREDGTVDQVTPPA